MGRILLATDAWHPQVNGVVKTLSTISDRLRRLGHTVAVIEPGLFTSLPVPFYPEIRVSLPSPGRIQRLVAGFQPDFVHIATEGTIGWQVRETCRRRKLRFSTSYHTRFPEYLARLMRVPESFTYQIVKRFHAASSRIMVATPSLEAELKHRGFTSPMARWSRGVDLSLFHPRPKYDLGWPRPYLLNVGRVSHEKGLEDFLRIDTPGTKIIVGDGPAKAALERKYPQAKFLGAKKGEELAKAYANADLFVFPSKTDTFGIVLIEALASGLPVAAYPVTGPVDIITDPRIGALNDDLTTAIDHALKNGDPAACPGFGQSYTWERSTEQFLANLVPVKG